MNGIPRTSLKTIAPAIARDSDLLRVIANSLAERLPSTWRVDMQLSPRLAGWRPDALLEISAPDGERGVLLVEAKLELEPRAIEPLLTAASSDQPERPEVAPARAAPGPAR